MNKLINVFIYILTISGIYLTLRLVGSDFSLLISPTTLITVLIPPMLLHYSIHLKPITETNFDRLKNDIIRESFLVSGMLTTAIMQGTVGVVVLENFNLESGFYENFYLYWVGWSIAIICILYASVPFIILSMNQFNTSIEPDINCFSGIIKKKKINFKLITCIIIFFIAVRFQYFLTSSSVGGNVDNELIFLIFPLIALVISVLKHKNAKPVYFLMTALTKTIEEYDIRKASLWINTFKTLLISFSILMILCAFIDAVHQEPVQILRNCAWLSNYIMFSLIIYFFIMFFQTNLLQNAVCKGKYSSFVYKSFTTKMIFLSIAWLGVQTFLIVLIFIKV